LDDAPAKRLAEAGLGDAIDLVRLDPCSLSAVASVVRDVKPGEIYNLAGQSSVAASFVQPSETVESVTRGALALLEAVRIECPEARLFNAGSSESFGDTLSPATESSPLVPKSPYGAAKAASMHLVSVYRQAYGLFVCSGITFNHESALRPAHFVTRKVARFAARLSRGIGGKLKVGNLAIRRDWGWAPEYVDGFHRMLQGDRPVDLILATGQSSTLAEFIAACFETVGLDAKDHIESDPALYRPSDLTVSSADPSAAWKAIGWRATSRMRVVARYLVEVELATPVEETREPRAR
jgi:GDPmannose 4,6-dehydratase